MKEIINPDAASNIELNENKIHFQNEYQYNTYICFDSDGFCKCTGSLARRVRNDRHQEGARIRYPQFSEI